MPETSNNKNYGEDQRRKSCRGKWERLKNIICISSSIVAYHLLGPTKIVYLSGICQYLRLLLCDIQSRKCLRTCPVSSYLPE